MWAVVEALQRQEELRGQPLTDGLHPVLRPVIVIEQRARPTSRLRKKGLVWAILP